ncbi:hypothetical protein GXW82_41630 [Streptacidiphilus sp. 4-A2]|nr:hypothetical protein [Streptacidiphilus sp. 4-A2]
MTDPTSDRTGRTVSLGTTDPDDSEPETIWFAPRRRVDPRQQVAERPVAKRPEPLPEPTEPSEPPRTLPRPDETLQIAVVTRAATAAARAKAAAPPVAKRPEALPEPSAPSAPSEPSAPSPEPSPAPDTTLRIAVVTRAAAARARAQPQTEPPREAAPRPVARATVETVSERTMQLRVLPELDPEPDPGFAFTEAVGPAGRCRRRPTSAGPPTRGGGAGSSAGACSRSCC